MEATAAKYVGARLLGEIEEETLEELLRTIRTQLLADTSRSTQNNPPSTALHPTAATTAGTVHARPPVLIPQPHIPFPALKSLTARYQKATLSTPPPILNISGRYLPLIYHLVSTLIASNPQDAITIHQPRQQKQHPGYTIVIIDAEYRFDVTRLISDSAISNQPTTNPRPQESDTNTNTGNSNPYPATPADLRHVYIFRPSHSQVRATLSAAAEYMLYGAHQSREREWWGTIIVGGSGLSTPNTYAHANPNLPQSEATATGGNPRTAGNPRSEQDGGGKVQVIKVPPAQPDILCGYKGWLKVDKEQVPGFHIGISAEEAMADRGRRWEVVERSRWRAACRWGSYEFG